MLAREVSALGASRLAGTPGSVFARFGPARAARPDRQEGAVLDLGKQARNISQQPLLELMCMTVYIFGIFTPIVL